MKFFSWRENKSKYTKKDNILSRKDFYLLSKEEQQKLIKKGAKEFSKNFTKTIVQLANE